MVRTIAAALVASQLDYANCQMWYPTKYISHLQHIQNTLIRFIVVNDTPRCNLATLSQLHLTVHVTPMPVHDHI